MGIFDDLKQRLSGTRDRYDDGDDYYDDYDDDLYDDRDRQGSRFEEQSGVRYVPHADEGRSQGQRFAGRDSEDLKPPAPHRGAYSTPSMFNTSRDNNRDSDYGSYYDSSSQRNDREVIYIMRPESYNDVQSIPSRLRSGQPVALSLARTKPEVGKRILDFSLGLSCGMDGSVEKLADKLFVILPAHVELSSADMDELYDARLLEDR